MDKCEIIERLKNIAEHAIHTVGEEPFVMSLDDGIAVHEAIELLNKPDTNCSEIPNNSDTISRQQAIDALDKRFSNVPMEQTTEILKLRKDLRELPSVQPDTTTHDSIPAEIGKNDGDGTSDDCISRQQAIDAICTEGTRLERNGTVAMVEIKQWCVGILEALPPAQPEQHGRVFKGIVIEYPAHNTYPEYKGKPYFSIKYTENGQEFIGYGTYKIKVLSEYLKEYFMPSAQPERKKGTWTDDASCPFCGFKPWYERDIHTLSFCPNCGADMRGGEDT